MAAPPVEMDTASLVIAARDGDERARAALLDAWSPVVLRWCVRLGGPHVDAEDAAHDVLVRVLTRLDAVREPARFDAWVFGATRRVLAWHRRKAWVRLRLPWIGLDPADPSPGPGDSVAADEIASHVRRVLDDLPADLREILVLCEVEGRTDEAAAALIGVPVGTAKSRLRRARGAFAQAARRHGLVPDPEDARVR